MTESRWEAKTPEEIMQDVTDMVDCLLHRAPRPRQMVLSLNALRGMCRFRNRKAKKAWVQMLQRIFDPPAGGRRAPLGKWWRFVNGGPLPENHIHDIPWDPYSHTGTTQRGDRVTLMNLRKGGVDV